jgi:hypothetical protein
LRDPVYAHRLFACRTRIMAESPCQGKTDSTYGLINSTTRKAPNVFFLSGVEGIGRNTTARAFSQDLYQNRRFSIGPQIVLEDPASIEDFYLRLYENHAGSLGNSYEKELSAYRALTVDEQVQRLIDVADLVCRDDETIFVRCRSGLFDADRSLIKWAKDFFVSCGNRSQVRLVIISNRQPRYSDIGDLDNVLHGHIPSLNQGDVDALVRAITLSIDGNAITPSAQARSSIGGHPVLARHYSYAVLQYGETAEERAVYDTILEQKNMLTESCLSG